MPGIKGSLFLRVFYEYTGRWNIFMRKVNNRIRKHLDHGANSINQLYFSHESAA
jgi:hypothetical protein